ncbi:MAG: tetratricopeptide repeat protein [Bacteroidetes bacterium]|nr:tetratricopeptide repeat protein [Bacteroidota bacterium]
MYNKIFISFLIFVCSQTLISQSDYELAKKAFQRYRYIEVINILSKNTKFENLSKKDRLEANYMLGESYRVEENYKLAEKYLLVAKDIDDEHIKTLISLGSVYTKQNQWKKGLKEFTDAEKEDKKNPYIPLGLANVYLEVDSVDKAIQYFTKARELDVEGKLPEIFIGLGDSYAKQNISSLAISNYNEAKILSPTNPQILIKLGLVYTKMKKGNEAAKALKEAVDLDPTNTQVLLDLGKMYYKSGIYKEAVVYYKKYLELKPTDFEILTRYAKSLYESKAFEDAIPVYKKLNNLRSSVDYQKQLVNCYIETDSIQNAISIFNTIPNDSMTYKDLIKKGKLFLKVQDTITAISNYRFAYEKEPMSSEVSGEMAAIFIAQKNFIEAEKEYDRIIRNDPTNFSAQFYGGFASFMLEKFEEAKIKFRQVVALRPEYIQGRMFYARMYQAQDSFLVAKEMLNNILLSVDTIKNQDSIQTEKNKNTKSEIYNALAVIEYKSENYLGAINELIKVIALESKEVKNKKEGTHLFLAQMYNVSRVDKKMDSKTKELMKKKSIEEYKLVLKINPNNATAKKELSQIN